MWIKKTENGWVFGSFENTTHITCDPQKVVFLYVDGKYLGLLTDGVFYFFDEYFDKVVHNPNGDIELHLRR